MTRVRSAIVNGRVETRVAIGAIRYGQKRSARRKLLIIVGMLLFFMLVAVALAVSGRPAHGAALRQVVCVLSGTQAICPPWQEIGEPPDPRVPCPPEAICLTDRAFLPTMMFAKDGAR